MKSISVERDELSVVKSHTTIKLGKYIFQVQEVHTRCKLVFTDILDAVDQENLVFSLCIKLFMIDRQQIGFELILRLILVQSILDI